LTAKIANGYAFENGGGAMKFLSIRRDWPALVLVALMFAASAWAWPLAPDRVPTHWGLSGEPNGWGSKPVGLLLLPATAFGLWALLGFLPRIDPGRANYVSFEGPYTLVRTCLVALLALGHGAAIAAALGHQVDMGRVLTPAIGVLFLLLGGIMGKIRQNWFFGVRTPWTLSSKLSWTRSNRLGGFVFIGVGAAELIVGPWAPGPGIVLMVVGLLGGAVFLAAYSWYVWKGDPDKQGPGGTTPG
jgi:uncharacterized membrane protein